MAIELFTAAQAFEFRRPLKSSTSIEAFYKKYRKEVNFIEEDVEMYPLIQKSIGFLRKL